MSGFGVGAGRKVYDHWLNNKHWWTGVDKEIKKDSGGLNLFKWGAKQTSTTDNWETGDYMLNLPDKGSPKLNWEANYRELRIEMKVLNSCHIILFCEIFVKFKQFRIIFSKFAYKIKE